MHNRRTAIVVLALAACAAAVAGCGGPFATIESVHPPLGHHKVETQRAAWMFSKGRVIEIVLERQWALPGGEAVPDVEYVHVVVPDAAGTYPVSHPAVEVTRYVRTGHEEFLYTADSGTVKIGFSWPGREQLEAEVSVETHVVYPADASKQTYPLKVTVRAPEDIVVAQGLVNRYRDTVERLRRDLRGPADQMTSPEPTP